MRLVAQFVKFEAKEDLIGKEEDCVPSLSDLIFIGHPLGSDNFTAYLPASLWGMLSPILAGVWPSGAYAQNVDEYLDRLFFRRMFSGHFAQSRSLSR